MSVGQTEQSLVEASRRGDRVAFAELVRRTARLVFARVYLEIGRSDRVEDLVQETFMVAWRSIRQVTDANGFRSWLIRVAQTVVIDAQRRDSRKKRSGTRAESGTLRLVADDGESPADSAEKEESRQRVLAALRKLPEEYRQPLMLRYIAGADYQTIERQLALSNGALRGMLSRGMAMMRRELKEG